MMKEILQNEDFLQDVCGIVKEASQLMKNDTYQVFQKGNASNHVTDSDVNVQHFLADELSKILPGSAILGEEEGASATAACTWVIDPIDGTANYIRGVGVSAISVGLVVDNEPFLGVVYQPYRDEMFYAQIGQGAYLNGKPIHVSNRDFSHSLLCSAMSLYDKNYAKPCFNIIERIYSEADDLRRLGSAAVELVYLAAGRVELYFEIRLFPWDVAGALPILIEAGAYVECLYCNGLPLARPFPVLAANSIENMEKLSKIVHEEIPSLPY